MQLSSYLSELQPGYLQWHSIAQTLLIRWFQIRYVSDTSIEQILITGDLEVLEAINADSTFCLLGVNLVSPPSMNGTNNWTLSPLRSVTTLVRRKLNKEELLGYEYHLDKGGVLFERFGKTLRPECAGVERSELIIRCDSPLALSY